MLWASDTFVLTKCCFFKILTMQHLRYGHSRCRHQSNRVTAPSKSCITKNAWIGTKNYENILSLYICADIHFNQSTFYQFKNNETLIWLDQMGGGEGTFCRTVFFTYVSICVTSVWTQTRDLRSNHGITRKRKEDTAILAV
jgi:hypothetical protein